MTDHPPYTIKLDSPAARAKALEALRRAPDGYVLTLAYPVKKKTSPQTDRFHAMVRDVAKALPEYGGILMDEDSWKDVFLDALFDGQTRLVPKLNRMGMLALAPHWKPLTIKQATDAITIVMAFGDQHNVTFKADRILEDSYGDRPASAQSKPQATTGPAE